MFDDIIGVKQVVIIYIREMKDGLCYKNIGIVKESTHAGCILTDGTFVDRRQITKILPDEVCEISPTELLQFFQNKKLLDENQKS